MLPIKLIRENPQYIKEIYKKRNYKFSIDKVIKLDEEKRNITFQVDDLRANRRRSTKNISSNINQKEKQEIIDSQKEISALIHTHEESLRIINEQLNNLLLEMPNILSDDVQEGTEEDAQIIEEGIGHQVIKIKENAKVSDVPLKNSYPTVPEHWEIGKELKIIDFERGVKISGQRFYVLMGDGAKLQRSLIFWMLETHTERGYSEVYPPALIKEDMLYGTAQLPKFGDNLYKDIEEDLWLVPTAEVPVTNLYRDEILSFQSIPIKHVAYTPCFRREKMSAGKEVKGIKRGHQFDKVELVNFSYPNESASLHQQLLQDSLFIVKELNLHYRVIQLAASDTSFASSKTYDIEVWASGSKEWLEVSSVSNFLDFQTRRANIKFKDELGNNKYLHTLNASGLALPRTLAALMEQNYKNGSITVPEVLIPLMKKNSIN
ncbi:MAG: seryl-tRNA synthetase [Chloroflexi bacterium]|jgi:seryl-tRNA synthetase|nr:MAG: seryl-tRNA synthetase [Chloroflexota bacterium]|tara:strand:- start:1015 stop:2316 length:1302 start_codon:yes stop_codon:yes gene_type:complete